MRSLFLKKKKEFGSFTPNLNRMFLMSRIYDILPFRNKIIQLLFRSTNRGLPIIKDNMNNIPDFTHENCFKIKKIQN